MQYDFTIPASGNLRIDVAGTFVKFVDGTGAIRVRFPRGEYLDLLPGQGVWKVDFDHIEIIDKSGAANTGTILAGDYDFRELAINADALSKLNRAFMGSGVCNAVAGQYSHSQLFNPAGSGKNLAVRSMTLFAAAACTLSVEITQTDLNTNVGAVRSKKSDGANSVAKTNQYTNAAATAGTVSVLKRQMVAAGQLEILLQEPLIIAPGYGVHLLCDTVNVKVQFGFEFIESGA